MSFWRLLNIEVIPLIVASLANLTFMLDTLRASGFRPIGKLATRHAREIESSPWSIGGETLDRDYAIYANYKAYLGPLGAKAIRLQGGWAKCEKVKGNYDFSWLSEVVNDALSQGVQPWIQLSYGNPIYPKGGEIGLRSPLPSSPEAIDAWKAWVRAIVRHFKDRVHEWEIWNEPDIGPNPPDTYAKFFLETAQVVRSEQPDAKIYALALANVGDAGLRYAKVLLDMAKELHKLDLISAITIHGYPHDPDDTAPVDRFRKLVANYSEKIEIRQGETGAPSSSDTYGALRGLYWSEVKQAKWNLRRMLAHYGKNVPFNLFTICDLRYVDKDGKFVFNRKGLLLANDDMTVARPKLAYFAAQRVFSIFDDTLKRIHEFEVVVTPSAPIFAVAYHKVKGALADRANIVVMWLSNGPPKDEFEPVWVDLWLKNIGFKKPVLADLLTGEVYEIPHDRWSSDEKGAKFVRIPVYDSPIFLAEFGAILEK